MGILFSCPFALYYDMENELESVFVNSVGVGNGKMKTLLRSVSFKRHDSVPRILKSMSFGKSVVEQQSSSLKKIESSEGGKMITVNQSLLEKETNMPLTSSSPKHEAALKLQKVYKSFRTRRKLADCAVLVEQSWWKLLDFAELKHSSISYFDIEKHETAISRWSRARTRAAKVGKGLSKNNKAQKLALQHWLEAIDPRHRYGHNLHFYYVNWLQSQSREPFFYWLDIGEGKEVNLDKCPRTKLQQQCIKYLGPMERKTYEIAIEDGKFYYKQSGNRLHTTVDAKWIFVLSTSKLLYVGTKNKGTFQHSSFLAGGATVAAGRLVVENGILKAVWPHSGHYRPTEQNFKDFISFLEENNVDLTDVKTTSFDEDDSPSRQRNSNHIRNNSEEDLIESLMVIKPEEDLTQAVVETIDQENSMTLKQSKSWTLRNLSRQSNDFEIPKQDELLERLYNENSDSGPSLDIDLIDSPIRDNYEEEHEVVETISEESILRRINSKRGTKSYQLGKQLSCKWTTGAGPRIGCVRDYPSELQLFALDKVNLSPKNDGSCRSYFAPRSTVRNNYDEKATDFGQLVHEMGSLRRRRSQSSPSQIYGLVTD